MYPKIIGSKSIIRAMITQIFKSKVRIPITPFSIIPLAAEAEISHRSGKLRDRRRTRKR